MKIATLAIVLATLTFTLSANAMVCVDGERVFADVPGEHLFCEEIESLYRDGMTTGCRADEDGTLYFCPDEPLTRAQGAVFAEHRDPFVFSDRDGRGWIMDHARDVERFDKGHYWIQFERDIQHCSMQAWPHDREGPGVEVDVDRLSPTIDTVEVFTTVDGHPTDMWFSVRIHCR